MELKKGETIMIDIALHLPATCLHEAFSNRSGLPPDHFELYYRSKRLEGEAALSSWGIEKDSAIEVKMRGRGGGDKIERDGKQLEASSSGASFSGASSSGADSSRAFSPTELYAMAELGENMEASEKEDLAPTAEEAARLATEATSTGTSPSGRRGGAGMHAMGGGRDNAGSSGSDSHDGVGSARGGGSEEARTVGLSQLQACKNAVFTLYWSMRTI